MSRFNLECLESREVPAATPKPVLLVIANQDFYYKEYNDTRTSLLAAGVPVTVAATTTNPATPHAGSGQGTGSGVVTPAIALTNANAADYSAIAFVGGWGASMYQYAFNDPNFNGKADNYYTNSAYNGDANINDTVVAPQKVAANNLINAMLAANKPVAGVCHGVTVLAWARVNGASPIAGKAVAVPLTDGTPGMYWNNANYSPGYALGQYDQALAHGAIVSKVSGQYGNPATVADDVIVDGDIITGENQNSAAFFGTKIAERVIADANPTVTGVSVNDGAAQRSKVTSLTVTFSAPVVPNPLANPIRITAVGGAELPQSQINYAFDGATVRLSFTGGGLVQNGSLADGRYTLTVPTAGHTSTFHRLFGDANGDATVNVADLTAFGNAFNTASLAYDANADGIVNIADLTAFGNTFGVTL